jgi:Protein of unknown function (DUF3667)
MTTLRWLVFRPGFLTAEYLAGRRARYVSPFRFYVIASFILFSAFSFIPVGQKNTTVRIEFQEATNTTSQSLNTRPRWSERIKKQVQLAQQNPDQFKTSFLSNLSKSLFLLMPLFAAMLYLLHLRKSETFFVEHIVLSLHFHTFSFLVILALLAISALPGEDWGLLPGLALFFWPPIYLGFALQRLYGRGWLRSFIKAILVVGAYGVVLSAALIGLLLLSLPH